LTDHPDIGQLAADGTALSDLHPAGADTGDTDGSGLHSGSSSDARGVNKADRRFIQTVRRTALLNGATALVGALTGVLLARLLGPGGRGEYAAITSLFGFALVLFEFGLAASVVYYVSRDRDRAGSYVGTVAMLLLPMALVGGFFLIAASYAFLRGFEGRGWTFFAAAACLVFSIAGTPAMSTLQALNIHKWNAIRLLQPVVLGTSLACLAVWPAIHVGHVIQLFAASLAVRSIVAWLAYRKLDLSPLRFSRPTVRPVLTFGALNLASTAPNSLNARLDQMLLALLIPFSQLGQYAVAVSLSVLVAPLTAAFGNVAFPQIARGLRVDEIAKSAVRGAFTVSLFGVGVVTLLAPMVVPILYGDGFGAVSRLLFFLAPGAVFFAVNQVLGDVLRGRGMPGLVARCEWVGVALTVVGLGLLVPRFGALGAAATSSLSYVAVHVLLWLAMRRSQRGAMLPKGGL
jgi:antigen flippase